MPIDSVLGLRIKSRMERMIGRERIFYTKRRRKYLSYLAKTMRDEIKTRTNNDNYKRTMTIIEH